MRHFYVDSTETVRDVDDDEGKTEVLVVVYIPVTG